ncbi:hypothetical protein BOSEA31B_13657 [Hyphomicrobiales bacterium]|nr:hypothetical protein BOSEA31B_13657 [Hyphomicrobiales bacterium]CAH1699428.1 hypothetical protein BOSEA1005_12481 [Hyphomicrobiales bacterium]CAI0343216.1 hypothetical protein BO1005MUT1_220015 [Hyphomicrobiales bacterium]
MRSFGNSPEKRVKGRHPVKGALMIPKYESHHPVCLDVEWLLPTLFDASLLTFEPPSGGSFFVRCLLPSPGDGRFPAPVGPPAVFPNSL